MYNKLRALSIIENNFEVILKYEKTLLDLRKSRSVEAKEISSKRRRELTDLMLIKSRKESKITHPAKYSLTDVAQTVFEYKWMFKTASILYFSNLLSNLKKKNHWLKSMFFTSNCKLKIYWGTNNKSNSKKSKLFCFLTNATIVDKIEDCDIIFYWLSVFDTNAIIKCVDDSNNISFCDKMVVFLDETMRTSNMYEIVSKKTVKHISTNFMETIEQFLCK